MANTYYVYKGQNYSSMQEVQQIVQASLDLRPQQATMSYAPPIGQQLGMPSMPAVQQQAGVALYQQAAQQQQPGFPMLQQQILTSAAVSTIQQGIANPSIVAQTSAEAVVKMEVGMWQVCEDQQGEFYVHTASGQQFEQAPDELLLLLQQVQAPAPVGQSPPEAQAMIKMEVGEWQVCEDQQGEYYVHTLSGQSFDQPPVELLQLLQGLPA